MGSWTVRHCAPLLCLLFTPFLAGCMSSGIIREGDFAFSRDGRTLAFADNSDKYVADAHGVRWIAAAYESCSDKFQLSQSGDQIVWFEDNQSIYHYPRKMVVYRVADGSILRVKTPEPTRPVEGYRDFEVYFDPSGGIVLKITYWRLDNGSPRHGVTEVMWHRWSPGGVWSETHQPPADWASALHPKQTDVEIPLAQFGPDGWNARRTIWVRPDGSTLEVARQNDILPMWFLYPAMLPIECLSPYYWYDVIHGPQETIERLQKVDNTAAQARLDQLIAERRAKMK